MIISTILIENYYKEVDDCIRYGGGKQEMSVRSAFYNLLNKYCKKRDLFLVPELDYKTAKGKTVVPDGSIF